MNRNKEDEIKGLLEENPTELLGLEEENDPMETIGSEDDEEEDPKELMSLGEEEDDEEDRFELGGLRGGRRSGRIDGPRR